MSFIHGWKAFTIVPAHDTVSLQDDEGGHLHNVVSAESAPDWEGDDGYKFYGTLEGAWQDAPSVYAHVTCLGPTILHEHGGRTAQYSVDYFLPADGTVLHEIADRLNVAILPINEGCPICRGGATEKEKEDWFGVTYKRPTRETRDYIEGSAED